VIDADEYQLTHFKPEFSDEFAGATRSLKPDV